MVELAIRYGTPLRTMPARLPCKGGGGRGGGIRTSGIFPGYSPKWKSVGPFCHRDAEGKGTAVEQFASRTTLRDCATSTLTLQSCAFRASSLDRRGNLIVLQDEDFLSMFKMSVSSVRSLPSPGTVLLLFMLFL